MVAVVQDRNGGRGGGHQWSHQTVALPGLIIRLSRERYPPPCELNTGFPRTMLMHSPSVPLLFPLCRTRANGFSPPPENAAHAMEATLPLLDVWLGLGFSSPASSFSRCFPSEETGRGQKRLAECAGIGEEFANLFSKLVAQLSFLLRFKNGTVFSF